MKVKSAIPHPLIMGVIHECGGKMHMQERDWESASKCLFDAFKVRLSLSLSLSAHAGARLVGVWE